MLHAAKSQRKRREISNNITFTMGIAINNDSLRQLPGPDEVLVPVVCCFQFPWGTWDAFGREIAYGFDLDRMRELTPSGPRPTRMRAAANKSHRMHCERLLFGAI